MSDSSKLKLVFTGSAVEASFVKNILKDNRIGCHVRDTLRESSVAGWVSGAPEDSNLVFVSEHHEGEAKNLIAEFLDSEVSE
ncbi:MAG: DUF2007 domain-containing protein [Bacteroidetes bacterium]|nr:DUF2007 domain-containing protein [Bacteroidota bacterium]